MNKKRLDCRDRMLFFAAIMIFGFGM
uniref:Uncharacterized protein n=1 Tax=Triticum urartu TaxID=4572 RepID=A0A8R7QHS5_TRIUA